MKTVLVNNKEISIPENWEDVMKNDKLFRYAVSLFFLDLTAEQLQLFFALKVFKISNFKFWRMKRVLDKRPNSFQADELLEGLAVGIEAVEFVTKKSPSIKDNYVKDIFVLNKIHSPNSILGDCVAWEFALAEDAFISFNKKEEEKYLDKLIAILYRGEKNSSFFKPNKKLVRVVFDENTIEARQERLKKVKFSDKWLIYRWYASQREIIIKQHPHVYKSDGDGDGGGLADTIISLSTAGNEERVGNTKLALILRRLENENKAAEKRNRK